MGFLSVLQQEKDKNMWCHLTAKRGFTANHYMFMFMIMIIIINQKKGVGQEALAAVPWEEQEAGEEVVGRQLPNLEEVVAIRKMWQVEEVEGDIRQHCFLGGLGAEEEEPSHLAVAAAWVVGGHCCQVVDLEALVGTVPGA
jgi:hypothetical protein